MENKPKIFVKGMFFKTPTDLQKEKVPWIKAKIDVKVDEAVAFLQQHKNPSGYVSIDVKKSDKTGAMYLELNQFVPSPRLQPVDDGLLSDGSEPPAF